MALCSNFAFLEEHDPVFLQLAGTAEQVFASDPNTTLIKLRQLGEALAQDVASRAGVEIEGNLSQADLIYRLDRNIVSLFHTLRVEGKSESSWSWSSCQRIPLMRPMVCQFRMFNMRRATPYNPPAHRRSA
ncbi:hypothetical protein [Pseudomonas sp. IT-P294]|uniref:hypothetical protein n=1 Tax=Pseudomonas sp. IT-P294 TaxID=3026454 RepID=UPI0039DF645D